MKLLLSSNSTLHGEPYLKCCREEINSFLAENNAINVVFIPFAAVTFSYDDYVLQVKKGLDNASISLKGIHEFSDPIQAIKEADAVLVGGGNSFKLLHEIYQHNLGPIIHQKVSEGLPYIGWSAGSNLACPTIKTTNDMPIITPPSFEALKLVPFQINPHYIHGNPPGHNGETREKRITEFLEINQQTTVIGLREGSILKIDGNQIRLIGNPDARIFQYNIDFHELSPQSDFSFLMES